MDFMMRELLSDGNYGFSGLGEIRGINPSHPKIRPGDTTWDGLE